jgi:hypothetical protein
VELFELYLECSSQPMARIQDGQTLLHLTAASLTHSYVPFQVALAFGWNVTDLTNDCRNALRACLRAFVETLRRDHTMLNKANMVPNIRDGFSDRFDKAVLALSVLSPVANLLDMVTWATGAASIL